MLFSYILQFLPDRAESGSLLADIFARLAPRLQDAFDSSLLSEASPEHQYIFRELFIHGQDKAAVAVREGKDPVHVSKILRECLLIIRKKVA